MITRRVVTVQFTNMTTAKKLRAANTVGGRFSVRDLEPAVYRMQITAAGYETVGQLVSISEEGGQRVSVKMPINHSLAHAIFPLFWQLPTDITRMLPQEKYDAMTDLEKAGLLNVCAKARAEGLIDCFLRVERAQGDRIYVLVSSAIGKVIEARGYHAVNGSLHKPPAGYRDQLGSYKSDDLFGNIQLTFFQAIDGQEVLADVDIDDAAGFRHAFQVIRNSVAGPTHPYNIREILLGCQGLNPGYRLEV